MKKTKCIYCGKKIKKGRLSAKKILSSKEFSRYKHCQDSKVVCEKCSSTLFLLQLT